MATKPGLFTDWPWKRLGSFKYVILAPWVIRSMSMVMREKGENDERVDTFNLMIIPLLMSRLLHNQIWTTLSRHRTAKGNTRIVDKTIEFDQVDRESNWDDQIILNGILFYIFNMTIERATHLPIWRTDGIIITILLHVGAVEFLYYWLHRAFHHHYLYSRYHSHHHSSVVTEPITSVIHPFAEHIAYFSLFAIPVLTTLLSGTASVGSLFGYVTYIDLMNYMGHCNFELIPNTLFTYFPPLKYFMYTPTYHSLHHTQFRNNYSLFVPIYDYIYGTLDESTNEMQENSLKRPEELPDVIHLTHLTSLDSIYHLRLGFASFASKPYTPKWYLWLVWPMTCLSKFITCIYGRTFTTERNTLKNFKLQSWTIPRYSIQYLHEWERDDINELIEDAILEAEARGTKVLSLGLLNQGEELNGNGELYIKRYPELKVKIVDGTSLAVASVINKIPKGTKQLLLVAKQHSKVASCIASALCQSGIQVATLYNEEYEKLKLTTKSENNLLLSKDYTEKVWVVGDELSEEDQMKAPKGTLFIPFSPFPPKKVRNDCLYHYTPSLLTPISLQNLDSCENWLPRRVMSAWRVAGIVHALEGWNENECGDTIFNIHKIWESTLKHGFQPFNDSY